MQMGGASGMLCPSRPILRAPTESHGEGRQRAMRQVLDEKTYRPGLGNYKRDA